MTPDDHDELLEMRRTALQSAQTVFLVRQRAEKEVLEANESLEVKSQELFRQREMFRVTLSSIGDAVVTTDTEAKITFLNPVAESLTGWTTAEANRLPLEKVFKIINEESRQLVASPVDTVLRYGIIVELANHTLLVRKDGSELAIEDSAAPILDAAGKICGAVLVFHDVSKRRAVEKRLSENEIRLRFLNELGEATRPLADPKEVMEVSSVSLGRHLRASRCAYAEVDSDGEMFTILKDYTDGCASTAGKYELSRFGGAVAASIRAAKTLVINDVDRDMAADDGGTMFNAIEVKAIVCCPLIKDGRLRAMMAVHQIVPRHWTPNEIALIEDVVERCWAALERARAESESRDRAERFRVLSEVVPLQVWSAHASGELDFVNQACSLYFGAADDSEVLGTGWANFVHEEDLPHAQGVWLRSLSTGERYEVEFRLRRFDGQYRWFLVRAQVMRDDGGRITKWFGTNTDIHDLKMAQAAAEHASRSKDEFLAVLSHELRTPLTPVLLTIGELLGDQRLTDDIRGQLGVVERNVSLEAKLIDDLLDFTRISNGKMPIFPKLSDAHSLIGHAIEIVRDEAQSKGIRISQEFDASHSGLVVDPARFQQVMWNLLRNAVKFTPAGGHVHVFTVNRNKIEGRCSLSIAVQDSGMGIEPAVLGKIFHPFEQAGAAGSHRFGGMGLGLSIARAIVEMHDGTLIAESDGAGKGATFTVQFPNAEALTATMLLAANASDSETDNLQQKKPLKVVRVLFVEDHLETLTILSRLLTRIGYEVTCAGTVTEALAAATQNSFDIVVSDLGLPDGSGNELMAELRRHYGLRGIALTGYGMEADVQRSRQAGFISHLIKPVDFKQLRIALESATRETQA